MVDDTEERVCAKGVTFYSEGNTLRVDQEIDGDGAVVSITNPTEGRLILTVIRLSKAQLNALFDLRYKL